MTSNANTYAITGSKDIAALIRKDLKTAYPGYKFSVTSGSHSVRVALMRSPILLYRDDKPVHFTINPYWTLEAAPTYYGGAVDHLTQAGKVVAENLRRIVMHYHWDRSDIQSDYFNVNFYPSISFGKWDRPLEQPSK